MKRDFGVIALFVILLGFPMSQLLAQTPSQAPREPKGPTAAEWNQLRQRLDELSREQADLQAHLIRSEARAEVLSDKLDTTTRLLEVAGALVVGLLSIGTLASMFGFIRGEHRAVAAETRAERAFTLAFDGETSAQKRASEVHEKFLAGSMETLELVNDTLTLAKETSERAAKTIESRARFTIAELDRQSQALLASVPSREDRGLVTNPRSRSTLRSLAQKIAGFEVNQFVLPDNLQLTAPCIFVRGVDYHLNQQFEEAIRSWNIVALSPDASGTLRCLAWWWIGQEQNNLNELAQAEQSFDNASQYAADWKRFEVRRILFETRFFNQAEHTAESLVKPFQQLLESVEKEAACDERDVERAKIKVTLANVLCESARDARRSGKQNAADKQFSEAARYYQDAGPQDRWASFGLGQVLWDSEDDANKRKAVDIFRKVRRVAVEESIKKEEPRSKVLARTTELICCLRVPEWRDEAAAIRTLVLQELGRVDERLTVYSQLQHRNVTKSHFQQDVEILMSETPKGRQPAA